MTIRAKQVRIPVFVLLLFALHASSCQWLGEHVFTDRTPCDYYLPEGFVGWAKITFGVAGAPALRVRNGHYVVPFSAEGKAETSTNFEAGSAHDHYWYRTPHGVLELPETGWGGGGLVWAGFVEGSAKEPPVSEGFFVGTERQYFKAVHDPRGG